MRSIYAVAILAVLFAATAAAYSMWSQTLSINANIETGKVSVSFGDYMCTDTGADPQMNKAFDNSNGEDVGTCQISVAATDSENNVVKLNFDISNAYPGYLACIKFNVVNTGTIPVKLYSYKLEGVNETALNVTFTPPEQTQINPGEASDTYTLCVGIYPSADEDRSYSFTLELTFAQWNQVSGP